MESPLLNWLTSPELEVVAGVAEVCACPLATTRSPQNKTATHAIRDCCLCCLMVGLPVAARCNAAPDSFGECHDNTPVRGWRREAPFRSHSCCFVGRLENNMNSNGGGQECLPHTLHLTSVEQIT